MGLDTLLEVTGVQVQTSGTLIPPLKQTNNLLTAHIMCMLNLVISRGVSCWKQPRFGRIFIIEKMHPSNVLLPTYHTCIGQTKLFNFCKLLKGLGSQKKKVS